VRVEKSFISYVPPLLVLESHCVAKPLVARSLGIKLDFPLKGYYNSYYGFREGGLMRVANTVELKNKTNQILKSVMKGNPVIITFRGKPAACITPLTEEELEDFVLENSPKVRKMIAEAEKDIQAGKTVKLSDYLRTKE
jgi:prevent-host-death family protein